MGNDTNRLNGNVTKNINISSDERKYHILDDLEKLSKLILEIVKINRK
ncbi:hypothetical protein PMY56_09805 [Clostridium tertium]|nr:hypothetical protein [Clostridium tertium]MDB1922602.1 hypothetical protein [Clostridium tertium]MDB1926433.1 hypothetical protein [Clostridium tertium]MDB1928959.1 hypothetical protein [Clostridium tertium]